MLAPTVSRIRRCLGFRMNRSGRSGDLSQGTTPVARLRAGPIAIISCRVGGMILRTEGGFLPAGSLRSAALILPQRSCSPHGLVPSDRPAHPFLQGDLGPPAEFSVRT